MAGLVLSPEPVMVAVVREDPASVGLDGGPILSAKFILRPWLGPGIYGHGVFLERLGFLFDRRRAAAHERRRRFGRHCLHLADCVDLHRHLVGEMNRVV
jgi:hypothetical protein